MSDVVQADHGHAASATLSVVYPDGRVKYLGRITPPLCNNRFVRPLRMAYYHLVEKPIFERNRKEHNREMARAYPDNADFAALVKSDEGVQ